MSTDAVLEQREARPATTPHARFVFFSGKGGVGKTTMAAATAVREAEEGRRTLIVTTDPASNLADVFEQEIGHRITPIDGVQNLWAMEIDPDRATEEYRERVIGPMRSVFPPDVLRVVEEQFRSPCTTEIASFDRFVDFMDRPQFDVVIFDTAPTGHTLRLLELPLDWSRHIEESARGSGRTCIGPVQAIQGAKDRYDQAIALLRDPDRTQFVFVLLPEETAIYETARAAAELANLGIGGFSLIVNGLLPPEACDVPFFRRRYEMQQRHLAEIHRRFPVPTRRMYLRDWEVKGLPALRAVGRDLYGAGAGGEPHPGNDPGDAPAVRAATLAARDADAAGRAGRRAPVSPRGVQPLLHPARRGQTRSIFFTGKGGVGKTTVACVTALQAARAGYRTLLLTTDPAAHLGQVLEQRVGDEPAPVSEVPGLWAVTIDQEKAVQAYRERILAEARERYSSEMLAAVREELESPCTEEMAAFDRFAAFVESRDWEVLVFDTAPTGHTLRLMELPFDYARQVELMVTTSAESLAAKRATEERMARLIARLRDPEETVFAFVVYPESTPVVEAHRAMLDLLDAGIRVQLVVANQVLPAEHCRNPFFARRRAMQERYLEEIDRRFGTPVLTLPLLDTEIRGMAALEEARRLLYGFIEST